MLSQFKSEDIKLVNKPWGWEKWIQEGNDTYPFVLKQIFLRAGQRTSLQVHKSKSESILILSGNAEITTYDQHFNCLKYLKGNYSSDEMLKIFSNLITNNIEPNDVIHIPPGTIHRISATSDLLYVEASTTKLDDIIRLQDDTQRQHGRIESEHH